MVLNLIKKHIQQPLLNFYILKGIILKRTLLKTILKEKALNQKVLYFIMGIIFEVVDKNGKLIRLTDKTWKHIKKHPRMDEIVLEKIKNIVKNPPISRYSEDDENTKYLYQEFKEMPSEERYLFISVCRLMTYLTTYKS